MPLTNGDGSGSRRPKSVRYGSDRSGFAPLLACKESTIKMKISTGLGRKLNSGRKVGKDIGRYWEKEMLVDKEEGKEGVGFIFYDSPNKFLYNGLICLS